MHTKRILVVEDNRSMNKFLAYRLKHSGFEVLSTGNGREALELFIREAPNLVILDLILPGLSGEEICKAIRDQEDEHLARTPIIMLTGKSSEVDRIVGRVIGADSYLTKPFRTEGLLKEVRRLTCETVNP